jgi:hypothetical protein
MIVHQRYKGPACGRRHDERAFVQCGASDDQLLGPWQRELILIVPVTASSDSFVSWGGGGSALEPVPVTPSSNVACTKRSRRCHQSHHTHRGELMLNVSHELKSWQRITCRDCTTITRTRSPSHYYHTHPIPSSLLSHAPDPLLTTITRTRSPPCSFLGRNSRRGH